MKKHSFICSVVLFLFIMVSSIYSQVELVPPSHPVYDYIKRMQLLEVIEDYNSSAIPLSREQIAGYIKIINDNSNKISRTDKKILNDLNVEFEYDVSGNSRDASGLFNSTDFKDIFSNKKQKYLYEYTDSNAAFFFDGTAFLSQRNSKGDSLGKHSITLGEFGIRVRGTLYNSVGFYLRMSNGQKLQGDQGDIDFAIATNPKFKANTKFRYENNNFDTYEGYIRYRTQKDWLSLMVGKEALYTGFGYVDKLFLSSNTVPFSYIKLDLKYKSLHYYFLYGTVKGDSLGRDIRSKTIASHRLNMNFSKAFRVGFFESIVASDRPFDFTYLNPLSFLRSADYNAGETKLNNAIMGLDMEVIPTRKLSFQASVLIDDLNFDNLFGGTYLDGSPALDNKFAWQVGTLWTDALWITNLTAALEYTRLNPFVYTHETNKSQYTNWTLPLGHDLPPNSDEIALKLSYDITHRLNLSLLYQKQRSANGIIIRNDTLIMNYGGNIERGDWARGQDAIFLSGNRINRDIVTAQLSWQPIRQYYIELKYVYEFQDLIYMSRKLKDHYGWLTLRVDY
ncbi:capsule assembly Wzi family protein [Bacteroidota bacterium]